MGESRWRALDDAAETPMQQLAWIRACAAGFGGELRIVVVEEGDELKAAAPMVLRDDGSLELVGARELSEPADFVYSDRVWLGALVGELARLKTSVVLPRLSATSPTLRALRRAFRGRGMVITRAAGGTPVLELGDDPEARFSGRRRSDLRRARRRGEELGPVETQVLAPSPLELEPLLAELFVVEAAGWKGARGTALANDAPSRRFFETYAAAAAAAGGLRLCRLRIGEETAAVQLAVEHRRRLWLLKIGYDERFARCSPGTLLLLDSARWAREHGLEAIEMLGGRDPWTRVWADEDRLCISVHAYPANVRGARSLTADASRLSRERIVKRAARHHVAGADLQAALEVCRAVGTPVALGYWDAPEDSPQRVESILSEALDVLGASDLDAYLSVKPAAFAFARSRMERILVRGDELNVSLHFDSTGPDDAAPTWKLLGELARPTLGCTVVGGWRRSLDDVERAVELGLRVRVVKGQWPDPEVDEKEGFLALVEALAGRAMHVGVATHDLSLAAKAIARLEAAGTPVEHELMLGLPRRNRRLARTRIYVPFGHPYLPYAPARARGSARVAAWVARDLIRGAFGSRYS